MIAKKDLKIRLVKAIFGCFFAMIGLFSSLFLSPVNGGEMAYAIESTNNADVTVPTEVSQPETTTQTETTQSATEESATQQKNNNKGESCSKSLGAIGWLVCPTTEKIADAVDWLYEKIDDVLVINPVPAGDSSPIYNIWKYCRGLTNIVFIIFLMVVIYSQITGIGITNYGIKKTLPKLIVAAVMVNLSFLICSLAVDLSNIIGDGLRGIFSSIQESVSVGGAAGLTASGDMTREMKMSFASMYSLMGGGAGAAVLGGVIAFETGAIWMLIPTVLGAIVAVVSGLITIALRQAVVALLIMVSPLAMVANILPNTEQWYKKWKDLLIKMLVFYPIFSLLFGASQLAGYAIMASAQDGFGILLGLAVQVFPLFFSWKLMQMSGTFLGTINTKLRGLAATPLAGSRSWAGSKRQLAKQKRLADGRANTPSVRLMQFMSDRKIKQEEDAKEYATTIKNRGLSYSARSNYKANGTLSKEGEEAYARQAENMRYQYDIKRHENNMSGGLGRLDGIKNNSTAEQKRRLQELDMQNMNAADALFAEDARSEKIAYNNAIGRQKRMDNAMSAYMDSKHPGEGDYKMHDMLGDEARDVALSRYNTMKNILDNEEKDIQYLAANASQEYDTKKKIIESKMQKYFEMVPSSQDIVYRLTELTKSADATENIDSIIAGFRVLNQRGDTDKLKQQMDNIIENYNGLILGTHASQALASFLMFEVKDSDPFLRRFGKYINIETAKIYDRSEDMRKEMRVTYDEYIRGYHKEPNGTIMVAKKPMMKLVEGTSLDQIERVALSSLDDSLKKAYGYVIDEKTGKVAGKWDIDGYLKKREELQTSFEPAFLSASMKWESGSEQINSGVKFWTGYEQKQMKDANGNVVRIGDGIKYNLKPVWESSDYDFTDDDGNSYKDIVRDYYKRKTQDFFKDQTTGQILGMRTDYREATVEQLLDMYLNGVKDDEIDSETSKQRNAEFEAARAEIQTRYGDLPIEDANDKRDKDLAKLKREYAGRQLRRILDKTGKLEQIYTTRRSGAANNAKDWLRQMLYLDNNNEINSYLSKKHESLKKKDNKREGQRDNSAGDGIPSGVGSPYNDGAFQKGIMAELDDELNKSSSNADPDTSFYKNSLDLMKDKFSSVGGIVKMYEDYKKDNPYADRNELHKELKRILNNFFDENMNRPDEG